MRVVVDTNVFVSGVFFTGPPSDILHAWRDGEIQLVITHEILGVYERVAEDLSREYPEADISSILDLLSGEALVVDAPALPEPVCSDPDDDKFNACGVTCGSHCIVSGDKHLLSVSGYAGMDIVTPRQFVDTFLRHGQ